MELSFASSLLLLFFPLIQPKAGIPSWEGEGWVNKHIELEMNTCDNIYEKILFFDDLSAGEQEEIRKHAEHCAGCRQKLREFQSIRVSLQHHQAEHRVDDELLERYSVYLEAANEPDYDGRRLTTAEIGEIREHLTECPGCRDKVERLRREYQAIHTYLENTDLAGLSFAAAEAEPSFPEKMTKALRNVGETIRDKISFSSPVFYPIAAGAIAGLLLLLWFGPFFRDSDNPYYHLAVIDQPELSFVTRGSMPDAFSKGLSAFQEGNYQLATRELEIFLSQSPDSTSQFYAHYLLGISCLSAAESDFLGRFQKIDRNLLGKGMEHLQSAGGLTDYAGFQEECYWYLGKAYLLKGDGAGAKELFEKMIQLKGRRFREAREIIGELDKILAEK
jgi:TolA-binding protein